MSGHSLPDAMTGACPLYEADGQEETPLLPTSSATLLPFPHCLLFVVILLLGHPPPVSFALPILQLPPPCAGGGNRWQWQMIEGKEVGMCLPGAMHYCILLWALIEQGSHHGLLSRLFVIGNWLSIVCSWDMRYFFHQPQFF